MERNLDLIRDILIAVEAGDMDGIPTPEIDGFTDHEVRYHVQLLVEAGYLRAVQAKALDDPFPAYQGIQLTWDGHDFLDATSSSKVWGATKSILGTAGGWTMEIAKQVAQQQLKQMLGLPPG